MSAMITLNFGKHAGRALNDVPQDYVRWLAFPSYRPNTTFRVPAEVTAAAQILHEANELEKEDAKHLLRQFHGATDIDEQTVYIVERLGDIDGLTKHESLATALEHLSAEFPVTEDGFRDIDTEDNRLHVWELLPTGHKKVVWQFSGDHWRGDEFEIDQGTLPGDDKPLYSMAYVD